MLEYYDFFNETITQGSDAKFVNIEESPKAAAVASGNFFIEYNCLQSWYMRCSLLNKFGFLKRLFMEMVDHESMLDFTTMFHTTMSEKLLVYGMQNSTPSFIYDKPINDDNRMLSLDTLKQCMTTHLEWYKQLDEEFQIEIFSSLIMLGGGAIIGRMYIYMRNHYRKHPFLIRTYAPNVEHAETKPKKSKKDMKKRRQEQKNKSDDLLTAKDPLAAIIDEKIKRWNEAISKYRREVEGKPKKEKKGKDKAKKAKKSTDKSSKSTKNTKNKGKEGNSIDFLQIMPIWIVKQILNYLDKKTLKKIKDVNIYWRWAVTSVEEDIKVRKGVDKVIAKLQKNVTPVELEQQIFHDRTTSGQLRYEKLVKRGTVMPKIRKSLKITGPPYEKSMLQTAIKDMAEEYALPVSRLVSHPRKAPLESEKHALHKYQQCVLNETGYRPKIARSKLESCGEISVFERISVDYSAKSILSLQENEDHIFPEESGFFNISEAQKPTQSSKSIDHQSHSVKLADRKLAEGLSGLNRTFSSMGPPSMSDLLKTIDRKGNSKYVGLPNIDDARDMMNSFSTENRKSIVPTEYILRRSTLRHKKMGPQESVSADVFYTASERKIATAKSAELFSYNFENL